MNRLQFMSFLYVALSGCTLGDKPAPTVQVADDFVTPPTLGCEYAQAFGNASHAGCSAPAQSGLQVQARIIQDPDADQRAADSQFLAINESAPLVHGDFVVVPTVTGYVDDQSNATQAWSSQIWRWTCASGKLPPCVQRPDSTLVHVTDVKTSWLPSDVVNGSFGTFSNGYEGAYYPAIAQASSSLYMPLASGKIQRVNLATGAIEATLDPFAGTPYSGDARTVAIGGVTVYQPTGIMYYTVTAFNATSTAFNAPPRESWLVEVRPDNSTRIKPWSQIATTAIGVPQPSDLCVYPFFDAPPGQPFEPTSSASQPPMLACGIQAPTFNSSPAISPTTGRIALFSNTHDNEGAAFMIEVDPSSLAPVKSYDTRGHWLTGCGKGFLSTARETAADDGFCPAITDGFTTHLGFDGQTNRPVAINGTDLTASSPVYSPDGAQLCVGGYDGSFSFAGGLDARGAQTCFSTATGLVTSLNQEFGWYVTPSAWQHDGTYSWLQDRDLFSDGVLGVAAYSPSFALQSHLDVSESDPDDANAAEFAVDFEDANIPFDQNGGRYAVNANGHLYKVSAAGARLEDIVLPGDDGGPRSIFGLSGLRARDLFGRIYVSYGGSVYVIAGTQSGPVPHIETNTSRAASTKALSRSTSSGRGLAPRTRH